MIDVRLDLGTRIRRSLLRSAFGVVVIDDQRSWNGISMLLLAHGIGQAVEARTSAKRIGVMLPTSGLFPAALLGVWGKGRTLVPLNYLLSKDDLAYVAHDADLDTIITVKPMLEFVGGAPEGCEPLLLEELTLGAGTAIGFLTSRSKRLRKDDTAVILYTSGTSGRPKGVMLSDGNLAANVEQVRLWATFTRSDVLFGVLPQFHSFGMTVLTLMPLAVGCRVVYSAKFVPKRVLELMRKHKPSAILAIPAMYNALRLQKSIQPEDFASARYIVSGGEPLSDDVYEGFKAKTGREICEGYGLTETAPCANLCRPEEQRRGTVGKPLPAVEERIIAPDGTVLGRNEDGEIRIKGPNIMKGYFKLPEETAAVMDDDGFFCTGDMGRIDDDGYLAITGRIKEMLIIGGENVFPREIEEVLNRHPSVNDSAVIGQADVSRGETALAFVELVDDAEFDESALRTHCRETLAQFKVPRSIRLIDALPRNATGKIMRRALKTETGQAVEKS